MIHRDGAVGYASDIKRNRRVAKENALEKGSTKNRWNERADLREGEKVPEAQHT